MILVNILMMIMMMKMIMIHDEEDDDVDKDEYYKVGDVKDRVCVLLDDMSDSCGTLCKVIIIKNLMTILMLIQMTMRMKDLVLHRQPTCSKRQEQRG